MIFNTIVSGGSGTGGILTITAPSGATAIISNDVLGKRYERIVSSNGTVVFKGLASGTWGLYITDGESVSETKSIIIDVDYDVILSFFKATININFPKGSTCTCTHVATGLKIFAPEDAVALGVWELTVPYDGEWEIMVTNGADTAYQTVEINSEGQNLNIETGGLLPVEYQKLEYIESTGSQYIDAGVITISPDALLESEIKFLKPTFDAFDLYQTLFSVYSPWENEGDVMLKQYNTQIFFDYFGSSAQQSIVNNEIYEVNLKGSDRAIISANTFINTGSQITNTTFFSSYLSIFANKYRLANSTQTDVAQYASARIYYLKMSLDGNLVRDFIPCYRRSDGVAGMYDKVTETFFVNSGNGDFIKGPVIS